MNNWEELVKAYMSRFFPQILTFERRGEIIVFKQGEDESLYNAWERYKRLLNYTSKGIFDAAYCGAFKRKNYEEAKQLIEDLAKCNYRVRFETSRSNSRLKGSSVIELNQMTAIEAKLYALMSKMGNHERRINLENEVGTVDEK